MEKPKAASGKNPTTTPAGTAKTPPAAPLPPVKTALPPLFRRIDWICLAVTLAVVFTGYCLTLAPELTLEDSGELATASYYGGIPHSPGYPVWTIYTWFWTLLPFHSVAWRVALGCAFAGAVASALLAFIVSRGSSMIIESIDSLKNIDRKWENLICLASGFVAGGLIGFNGYMWSQSVIVEVYGLSVVSLLGVVLCLLRWMYAPHQHRYLYWAFFLYGICFNNHQSLLVIAMGMETLIVLAEPRLGRELLAWNTIIYMVGLMAQPETLGGNTAVLWIFNIIGLGSAILWFWLLIQQRLSDRTKPVSTINVLIAGLAFVAGIAAQPKAFHRPAPNPYANPPILKDLLRDDIVPVAFYLVGFAAICIWVWLCIDSKKKWQDFIMDAAVLALGGSLLGLLAGLTNYVPSPDLVNMNPVSDPLDGGKFKVQHFTLTDGKLQLLAAVFVAAAAGFGFFIRRTRTAYREWGISLGCGLSWLIGAAFYFYMPIGGMTNPPMQWAYPRTVEGFIHAMTRGQYEKIRPTTGENLGDWLNIYGTQLWRFLEGLNDEFNILFLLIAFVVFLFYRQMKRRERVWIWGVIALFICLGPFLVVLLNFPSDRQSLELNRVFLTSSHVMIAMFVGYGLTILGALMATRYEVSRKFLILGGICAVDTALFMLISNNQTMLGDLLAGTVSKLAYFKLVCWLLVGACIIFIRKINLEQDRLLSIGLPALFIVASLGMTITALVQNSGLGIFFSSIPRWFSPTQYAIPMFAGLILLIMGIVFLVSVWRLRSRAPLGITIALIALMPTYSIMTHWSDNEQHEHWFGYWFGHDMFTPPFVNKKGELSYDATERKIAMDGPNKDLVYPEMARDAILFGGTDPGRFCPTYMIFCDSFIPRNCQPEVDPDFNRRDVYIITQNALADAHYLEYIRAHYFRSAQKDPPFFQELLRGPFEKQPEKGSERKPINRADDEPIQTYTNALARLAFKMLDEPLTRRGSNIESGWRKRGVYPPKEIYTPSNEDSQIAFQRYMLDAQQRIQHDQRFPNEPRQVKPGEEVRMDNAGHVQVSGQIAVMAINALLTKVIFDNNPTNEFYVEESFPLDWMFPYLTPFGVIMKIEREPIKPPYPEEVVKRDHEFWAKYSERLIGNWITYDTTVKEITEFVERVYQKRDLRGFKGNPKLVRDDQGRKAFSKLRSSIGGIYAYRVGLPPGGGVTPQEYVAKTEAEQRMLRNEAEFAYKQAFAFCPYSPEAVYRYVNLLVVMMRIDDAMLVAETYRKLDPYNPAANDLIKRLNEIRGQMFGGLEEEVQQDPNDFGKGLALAQRYLQFNMQARAIQTLEAMTTNPKVTPNVIVEIAKAFFQMKDQQRLETTLSRLVQLSPDSPEAWYDLSGQQASLGKQAESIKNLKRALELNAKRLAQNPTNTDLRNTISNDARFNAVRSLPEVEAMLKAR